MQPGADEEPDDVDELRRRCAERAMRVNPAAATFANWWGEASLRNVNQAGKRG